MKFRIIASLCIIVLVVVLYVALSDPGTPDQAPTELPSS
jgi:hypothetical protein